jgi:hypothetical protein
MINRQFSNYPVDYIIISDVITVCILLLWMQSRDTCTDSSKRVIRVRKCVFAAIGKSELFLNKRDGTTQRVQSNIVNKFLASDGARMRIPKHCLKDFKRFLGVFECFRGIILLISEHGHTVVYRRGV